MPTDRYSQAPRGSLEHACEELYNAPGAPLPFAVAMARAELGDEGAWRIAWEHCASDGELYRFLVHIGLATRVIESPSGGFCSPGCENEDGNCPGCAAAIRREIARPTLAEVGTMFRRRELH